MSEMIHLTERHGVKVFVDKSGRFHASVGDIEKTDDTLSGLANKIELALKLKEKSTRRKINVPVINEYMEAATLTGVHAGHGKLITKPAMKFNGHSSGTVYYDCELSRNLLAEKRRLNERMDKIGEHMASMKIESIHKYRCGGLDESQYDDAMQSIEDAILKIKKHLAVAGPDGTSGKS